MKKIALLTTDSIPTVGGISEYLHGLLLASSTSIDWNVYSTIQRGDFDDASLPYRMVRLEESRRLGQRMGDAFALTRKMNTIHWRLSRQREARIFLRKVIQKCRPDLVMIGRWYIDSHFWCKACQEIRLPYVVFCYGLELVEPLTFWQSTWRRKDLQQATGIISISAHTSHVLNDLGVSDDKIVFIPPGILTKKLQPLPEGELNKEMSRFGLTGRRYILALGRLVKRKGFDLAIRAFAAVATEYPDIALVVAGDGCEKEEIEKIAGETGLEDRLSLLGKISDREKLALMQQCEFFLMPTRPVPGDMEGFGIVYLEAGALGKAVIGGNNGGVPDAVDHNKSGLLVDTELSLEPLVLAIRYLLDNPAQSRKMGEYGQQRALNSFSWEKIASSFVKYVENQLT